MAEQKAREHFPRHVRLHTRRDFDRVFRNRIYRSDRWLTIYVAVNDCGTDRLGISVSRKFGIAVRRNRVKRLIREAFRRLRHQLPGNIDWVVVPKAGTEPGFGDIRLSLQNLTDALRARIKS